jgi:hypothetical protein
LNARAQNWRQKARSSVKGFAYPSRLFAGEERDAEVIVAMTRPLFLRSRLAAKNAVYGAENQFWPDLLKDGFNCRDLAHTWCPPRIHPW